MDSIIYSLIGNHHREKEAMGEESDLCLGCLLTITAACAAQRNLVNAGDELRRKEAAVYDDGNSLKAMFLPLCTNFRKRKTYSIVLFIIEMLYPLLSGFVFF